MDKPLVHILIPFVRWDGYVVECVEHILTLKYTNYLLVLLPDVKVTLPQKLRDDSRIRLLVTGEKSIAGKRNLGLQAFSQCQYFAFIDADAYPCSDWLTSVISCFSRDENIWAVGGPNITPPSEPLSQQVVGNASKSILVTGISSFRKQLARDRFCGSLPTCNLIVSKDAMVKLEGFNEELITGEDIDICNRIVREEKKIYYSGSAVVYHHNRRLLMPFVKQRFTYGLSVFRLFKENPSLSNLYIFLPLFFLFFLAVTGIISIFIRQALIPLFAVLAIYFIAVFVESIRWSPRAIEIPGTFIAIVLGTISPGFGSVGALFLLKKDRHFIGKLVRRLYVGSK